jgi:WD40 repeat protein
MGADDVLELEHVIGYTGRNLGTVQFCPGDKNIFIKGMGAVVVIGDLSDPHNQEFLRGHDEEITALAVSPSGNLIASGQRGSSSNKNNEAPLIIWDFASRKELYQLNGFVQGVLRVAFSSDERFLMASGDDNRLFIWDMSTGEVVVSKVYLKPITMFAWGEICGTTRRPEYTFAMSYSLQGIDAVSINTLKYDVRSMMFCMEKNDCLLPTTGLIRDYKTSLVTSDKQFVLAGTTVGDFVVFNMVHKTFRASVAVCSGGLLSMAVCPKTGSVFCGGGDGTVRRVSGFDTQWAVEAEVQLLGRVVSLSLSSDGLELLAGTSTGKIYQVLADDLSTREISNSHTSPVAAVAFGARRSDLCATVSEDGSLRVWDLSDYSVLCAAHENSSGSALAITDDGNSIISGWADGFIRCHSTVDASKSWEIARAHRDVINSLSMTSTYLVSGGADGAVRVWAMGSRELIIQFTEHRKSVTEVLVDLDDPSLIHSCSLDRNVFTYNLKSERRTVAHSVRGGAFTSMTQRMDSEKELVTVASDGHIMFWDCDVVDPVASLLDPNRMRLTSSQISPSGRYLAVCGDDHQVKIYDIVQGLLISCGHGHSGVVRNLRWSPDSRQLVSVGVDCCIVVWNFYAEN